MRSERVEAVIADYISCKHYTEGVAKYQNPFFGLGCVILFFLRVDLPTMTTIHLCAHHFICNMPFLSETGDHRHSCALEKNIMN